ncbi:MAG: type II toxin-antitoxin system Phd/YefM family antitoxin [Candidatus Gracilibacteria bacterium]
MIDLERLILFWRKLKSIDYIDIIDMIISIILINIKTMKTINAMSVRRNFGTILDEVYYTKESVIIERRGQGKAMLVPIDSVGLYEVDEDKLSSGDKGLISEVLNTNNDKLLNL